LSRRNREYQMVRFEEHVVINRPATEVFTFISDPQNDPSWAAATRIACREASLRWGPRRLSVIMQEFYA